MDEVTEAIVRGLEVRRGLAQSLLDGYAAGALGEPEPGEIAGYNREIAECDAELAELGRIPPTPPHDS